MKTREEWDEKQVISLYRSFLRIIEKEKNMTEEEVIAKLEKIKFLYLDNEVPDYKTEKDE